MIKETVRLLIIKARKYSFYELLRLEWEAFLGWGSRWLGGFPGFVLRFLVNKLLFKRIGFMCYIQPNVFFVHSERIVCGYNFCVNSNSYINGVGGIEIGNNVLLGSGVVMSSGEHQYSDSLEPFVLQKIIPKKITIGDGVWIGANAVIMPGVIVAEGTVVGAGAVVTKSTEPFSVVVGVPARKIKMRVKNMDHSS